MKVNTVLVIGKYYMDKDKYNNGSSIPSGVNINIKGWTPPVTQVQLY